MKVQSEEMESARRSHQVHLRSPGILDDMPLQDIASFGTSFTDDNNQNRFHDDSPTQELTAFSMSPIGIFDNEIGCMLDGVADPLPELPQAQDESSWSDLEIHLPELDASMESFNQIQDETTAEGAESLAEQIGTSSSQTSQSNLHLTRAFSNYKPTSRDLAPTRMQSSKSSIPSLLSLGRRLSMKYSESLLGDVISIMRNFSVSSKANERSTRKFGSWLKLKLDQRDKIPPLSTVHETPAVGMTETQLSEDILDEHPIILPGSFSMYCWEGITRGRLEQCVHAKLWGIHGPNCGPSLLRDSFLWKISSKCLNRDDLIRTDPFGNTFFHVTIALGTPANYLSYLIKLIPDVNACNSAGQTFLHVVPYIQVMDFHEIRDLLRQFKRYGFNFFQRDQHGQTPFHSLARPWKLGGILLSEISKDLDLPLPFIQTARDNLGYTIARRGAASFSEDGNATKRWSLRNPLHVSKKDEGTKITGFTPLTQPSVQNSGKLGPIETIEDLYVYEKHADLLRVIVKACTGSPFAEDPYGRNGLHCLAQVALDLPVRTDEFSSCAPEIQQNPRERYLDDLLAAGVDIHQHDKEGDTPLISFIKYRRIGEDDSATTRIISRLCDAGADINRRDREGETPLHHAVKLGRRAVTKCLLARRANIHARNSAGQGILAVGTEFSRVVKGETLYAQIMLCISLVVNAGAVASPSLLQEWATPTEAIITLIT